MISKLLHLQKGEFGRLWPFFLLYAILFSALTLADGLSLALFVQHPQLGAERLPTAYAVIAVANLLAVGLYFLKANKGRSPVVFGLIIGSTCLLFTICWASAALFKAGIFAYGLLYIAREISSTMLLLHFGAYLADFFSRSETKRVLPIIYAGGRVGGIFGAAVLENLSKPVGLNNLILLVAVACAIAFGGMLLLSAWMPRSPEEEPSNNDPEASALEQAARDTVVGFVRYLWLSRLLFWMTCTTLLFVTCRWLLNFQYNSHFQIYWELHEIETMVEWLFDEHGPESDSVDMAQFMGRYTQIALAISLVMQLFVVNRLISWIGVLPSHLIYSGLVGVAMALNLLHGVLYGSQIVVTPLEMTLCLAVYCRFVENELRLGLRNPLIQIITNYFSKPVRARVRAWTLGVLVPVGTLLASGLLGVLTRQSWTVVVPLAGVALGVFYLTCVWNMGRNYEKQRAEAL